MMQVRWSDNDRHFGPLTFAKDGHTDFGLVATSQDDEERPAYVRLHILGRTILAPLPKWLIRPHRVKVGATYWDAATIARMGRDWYWDVHERSFGFTFSEGALHLYYGAVTNDSLTDKSRCIFLPWREWRHVRHSLYGLDGGHFADLPTGPWFLGLSTWDEKGRLRDACPTVAFRFRDFDGEEITATTRIEESEWHAGTGWFKWLALIRGPKVSRSLDLHFSAEVGEGKGSWKGGTIGHSIKMLPGELHEAAFRRYCANEGLTFVSPVIGG